MSKEEALDLASECVVMCTRLRGVILASSHLDPEQVRDALERAERAVAALARVLTFNVRVRNIR